jgi:hypothetical protein
VLDAIGKKIEGCNRGEYLKDFEKCMPCQTCPVGSFISQECMGKGTRDTTQCEKCQTNCPFGKFLTDCDGTTVKDTSRCTNCTSCANGFYNSGLPCFEGKVTSDSVVCSPCPVCDDGEVCLAGECVTDPGTGFAALLQWYNGSNLDLYVLSPFSKWPVCTVSPTNPLLEEGEEEFEYQGLCDVGTYEVDCDGTCGNPQHDYVIYQSPTNGVFQVTVVGNTITEPTHYLLTIFNNGIVKTLTGSITKKSPIVNVPFDCGDCLGDEYLFIYDGVDDFVCNDYQDCGVVEACIGDPGVCTPCSDEGTEGSACLQSNGSSLGVCLSDGGCGLT